MDNINPDANLVMYMLSLTKEQRMKEYKIAKKIIKEAEENYKKKQLVNKSYFSFICNN